MTAGLTEEEAQQCRSNSDTAVLDGAGNEIVKEWVCDGVRTCVGNHGAAGNMAACNDAVVVCPATCEQHDVNDEGCTKPRNPRHFETIEGGGDSVSDTCTSKGVFDT